MDFDFDESSLYRVEKSSTPLAVCEEKKKPTVKVNRPITVRELEDCFVESYVQDYFESRNNSIFRKFIKEVYRTVYDISSYFDELKKEAFKDKPKNDKLWYKKYKS